MITNVSAAVVDLKAETYTSNDGHTIIVNADKTISYEGTYALTLNEKDVALLLVKYDNIKYYLLIII